MRTNEPHVLGAVQIKDGLFIGDAYAAQDLDFIVTNKVTHIINCAGKQIPNHWETVGVSYLTLKWIETDSQNLFDAQDILLNEIYRFIEATLLKGESVLVHSLKGQNRSCCVLAAYLMKKYRWTLYKSLEYLNSRKSNLEIRASFFNQLLKLESRLEKIGQGARTSKWNEISDDPKNIESEELLLTNTFLNSKRVVVEDKSEEPSPVTKGGEVKPRVRFDDHALKIICPKERKAVKTQARELTKTSCNARPRTPGNCLTVVKSILKGSGKIFQIKPQDVDVNGGLKELDANAPLQGPANIRGNIIHITVNNFITNSNLTTTPKKNLDNSHSIENTNQEKVTASPRNKKFMEQGPNSHRQNENTMERSEDLSFDTVKDDKFRRSDGFSLISNLKKLKSPRIVQNSPQDSTKTKAVVRKFRFTVSNSSKKPTMHVYDRKTENTINSVQDNNAFLSYGLNEITRQPAEKDLKAKSAKISSQSYESENRGPSYSKGMNSGPGGLVKPKKAFRIKDLALADSNFNFATEEQVYSTPRDRLTPRPMTAPEQPMFAGSKSMTNFSLTQSSTPQIRKGRALGFSNLPVNTQGQRQSSIQASRDSNLAINSERERYRSSSPSQQNGFLFVPFRKF